MTNKKNPIDRNDLNYSPKKPDMKQNSSKSQYKYGSNEDWEEEKRQKQQYWDTVNYARSQLYDYYGTGAHFFPAMYVVLGDIKNWSPEKILEEASKLGKI